MSIHISLFLNSLPSNCAGSGSALVFHAATVCHREAHHDVFGATEQLPLLHIICVLPLQVRVSTIGTLPQKGHGRGSF